MATPKLDSKPQQIMSAVLLVPFQEEATVQQQLPPSDSLAKCPDRESDRQPVPSRLPTWGAQV